MKKKKQKPQLQIDQPQVYSLLNYFNNMSCQSGSRRKTQPQLRKEKMYFWNGKMINN